jgi:hypothetical protein
VSWYGLGWLLLALGPLLFLQRRLHWEIQSVFLLLTRRVDISIYLFSILFFPGILLHETSHYVMARLLLVRTGRFSLLPEPLPNGRLQLGYVETAQADWLRETLIGAAPLLTGGAFVAYAGLAGLGMLSIWQSLQAGGVSTALNTVPNLISRPDFWLWLYLTLVISSTMLPSASDRRAWLPLAGVLVALLAVSLLAGAGPWMAVHLAPYVDQVFKAVAVVLGISAIVHGLLLFPIWIMRRIIARLTGLEVVI